MNVFFFEAFEEEEAALRRYTIPGIQCGYSWKTIQELGAVEPPAPVISIRTQSLIPPAWADGIVAVLTRSTGYDHLAAYRNLTGAKLNCGYLPLYCNRGVAEQAMLLWMVLLRKLPVQMRQFAGFNRDGITGREAMSKKLLVVGVGNIGSEIVKIGHGLGMKVFGADPVEKYDFVDYVEFSEGATQADIVVCAMNLTSENNRYFKSERLALLKRGAIFVNIARGEFSPAPALLEALKTGQLSGVGLDVYDRETELGPALRGEKMIADPELKAVLELMKRDDVILTPHNAFNTTEAVERKSGQSMQQLEALTTNGSFIWNVP